MSIAAGLSVASLILGVSNTEAAAYTVQKGDSLWSIAQKYGTTINDLKEVNDLNSMIIYPNQVIKVGPNSSSSSVSSTTYTVKGGDSLYKIAVKYNVGVSDIMQWNNLKNALIYPGDVLIVSANGPAGTSSAASTNSVSTTDVGIDINKLVSVAKSLTGTPYVWGGTSPAGFDCSGFVYYVLKQAGMDISRLNSEGFYNRSYYVSNPQAGDLIFFKNTYKSGISDVGIYLGNNQFISASNDGVSIKSLSNSYWKSHFDSIKRLY